MLTLMTRQVPYPALIGLMLLLSACVSPVGVTPWSLDEAYQEAYSNALSTGRPTSFTVQVLLRLNLYQQYKSDPEGTLAELHRGLRPTGDEQRLFALAEL
jgi:hypothetical protein